MVAFKDVLLRMNLRIQDARGQRYDGAATMAGHKTGVATQIKALNRKRLFTHRYGHALNLAVGDSIKAVSCLNETFEVVREICKLVKKSPQRDTHLSKLRAETSNVKKEVRTFCPTRWTVRAEALASMVNNHIKELMELWDWSLNNLKDTEMKARVRGVKSCMATFSFYFGCSLGEMLLRQTDNLSTLQGSSKGNALAQLVIKTLQKDRCQSSFELFWSTVIDKMKTMDIDEPQLPRIRRVPSRFEIGAPADTNHCPATAK